MRTKRPAAGRSTKTAHFVASVPEYEVQLKSGGEQTIDWILGAYYNEKNRIRFDIDQRNGYRDGTFSWAGSSSRPIARSTAAPYSVRPYGA